MVLTTHHHRSNNMTQSDLVVLVLQKLSTIPNTKLALQNKGKEYVLWLENADKTTYSMTIKQED